MTKFQNREEAGRQLAVQLSHLKGSPLTLLAIPRGGIPVAKAIAQTLATPIEVVPLGKLALAHDLENPFGCVSNSGELYLNQALVGQQRVSQSDIYQLARTAAATLTSELNRWGIHPPVDLSGTTALIVDDGMHSGWTMFSALEWARSLGAAKLVVAIPVSHARAVRFIQAHCDEILSLSTEDLALFEIGNYYTNFPEIADDEIRQTLNRQVA